MVKVTVDASCLGGLGGGGATYDDTEIINRIKALEGRTDNFVSQVTVSREGDKVKLTYTRVDGTSSEVEFDDKDTISIAYDDTALKERVIALEAKEDNDKQTLSLEGNTLSISNGNSVELPIASTVKPVKVSSTSEGVTVTPKEEDGTTNYDVNINGALEKYYDKSKTYTKEEVNDLVVKQEQKATDITVYRGTFTNKEIVKEGALDTDRSPRITLTYSSSTGVGIFKIDLMIMSKVFQNTVIARLPNDAPVPVEFVESQVWIGDVQTSIWINKDSREVRMFSTSDPSIFNKRIILNIPGIFKKA